MEWVGRRIYGRDFWKCPDDSKLEIEFLAESDDDDADVQRHRSLSKDVNTKRWIRILRSAIGISDAVDGFSWIEGKRAFTIDSALEAKVAAWKEEERLEKLADQKRSLGRRWFEDGEEEDEMYVDTHIHGFLSL